MIQATLKILGKTYTAEGETVIAAISKLQPQAPRFASVLTLRNATRRQEKILSARITNKTFGQKNPLLRTIVVKQAALLFDTALLER